ncbi:MAG: AAA family ATPase [Methylococcales bacterium]
MEILKINNFLCIENAEIEIKRINLFIGEQAQGKSVIAKLIYFFKEYPYTLIGSIYRGITTKEGNDAFVLAKFEKIFPAYTWSNTEFNIEYSNKYYSIAISCKDGKLNLNTDSIIREVFTALNEARPYIGLVNNQFVKIIGDKIVYQGRNNFIMDDDFSLLDAILADQLFKQKNSFLEKNIYIPAGRSFFATLGNNIFSFINSEIKIDYFLILFGKTYQSIREDYYYWREENKEKRLKYIIEKIIGGQSLFENGQDWIVNQRGKISLADASSGQQESLPIITVLLKSPYFHHSHISNHFIIEEPEAHLFPQAQSYITQLISNAYNEGIGLSSDIDGRFNSFTITTHSPYILTAFNNLIQAGNVAQSKNYQNLEELYKVVPKDEIVNFDDVSAYFVGNGTVKSILDEELKLIDASFIDSVSRDFANVFEKLVIMEENND